MESPKPVAPGNRKEEAEPPARVGPGREDPLGRRPVRVGPVQPGCHHPGGGDRLPRIIHHGPLHLGQEPFGNLLPTAGWKKLHQGRERPGGIHHESPFLKPFPSESDQPASLSREEEPERAVPRRPGLPPAGESHGHSRKRAAGGFLHDPGPPNQETRQGRKGHGPGHPGRRGLKKGFSKRSPAQGERNMEGFPREKRAGPPAFFPMDGPSVPAGDLETPAPFPAPGKGVPPRPGPDLDPAPFRHAKGQGRRRGKTESRPDRISFSVFTLEQGSPAGEDAEPETAVLSRPGHDPGPPGAEFPRFPDGSAPAKGLRRQGHPPGPGKPGGHPPGGMEGIGGIQHQKGHLHSGPRRSVPGGHHAFQGTGHRIRGERQGPISFFQAGPQTPEKRSGKAKEESQVTRFPHEETGEGEPGGKESPPRPVRPPKETRRLSELEERNPFQGKAGEGVLHQDFERADFRIVPFLPGRQGPPGGRNGPFPQESIRKRLLLPQNLHLPGSREIHGPPGMEKDPAQGKGQGQEEGRSPQEPRPPLLVWKPGRHHNIKRLTPGDGLLHGLFPLPIIPPLSRKNPGHLKEDRPWPSGVAPPAVTSTTPKKGTLTEASPPGPLSRRSRTTGSAPFAGWTRPCSKGSTRIEWGGGKRLLLSQGDAKGLGKRKESR